MAAGMQPQTSPNEFSQALSECARDLERQSGVTAVAASMVAAAVVSDQLALVSKDNTKASKSTEKKKRAQVSRLLSHWAAAGLFILYIAA